VKEQTREKEPCQTGKKETFLLLLPFFSSTRDIKLKLETGRAGGEEGSFVLETGKKEEGREEHLFQQPPLPSSFTSYLGEFFFILFLIFPPF